MNYKHTVGKLKAFNCYPVINKFLKALLNKLHIFLFIGQFKTDDFLEICVAVFAGKCLLVSNLLTFKGIAYNLGKIVTQYIVGSRSYGYELLLDDSIT